MVFQWSRGIAFLKGATNDHTLVMETRCLHKAVDRGSSLLPCEVILSWVAPSKLQTVLLVTSHPLLPTQTFLLTLWLARWCWQSPNTADTGCCSPPVTRSSVDNCPIVPGLLCPLRGRARCLLCSLRGRARCLLPSILPLVTGRLG